MRRAGGVTNILRLQERKQSIISTKETDWEEEEEQEKEEVGGGCSPELSKLSEGPKISVDSL
jgi:hypothetical protein